ncbi:MAG TPA: TadE/TadG family type IV pilus assembly protein, partial [Chloroflexia bacterium]|nr:TadE/TadG family type IV pilus assembly protein [Chloroflexia bacterium]
MDRRHTLPAQPLRRAWRSRVQRRGQALLELALVLPLLAVLLLGVFDIGRAFADQESVTNAARQGARYAARNPADL